MKSVYFGDTTASGTGLTTAEILTLSGNVGGATLGLTSNIYMPSTNASKITLGSDLNLNLSNAAHQILTTVNSNVTAQWTTAPVLVVNSLVTRRWRERLLHRAPFPPTERNPAQRPWS